MKEDSQFFFTALPSGFAPLKNELLPWKLLLFLVLTFLLSMLGVAVVTELVPVISVALLLSPPVGGYLSNVMVVVAVFLAAVLGIFVSSSLLIVPQGFVLLTLTLGRRRRRCNPGIRWLIPLIERPIVWVSIQKNSMSVAATEALSGDNIPLDVNAILFFTLTDPLLAYFGVSGLYELMRRSIESAIREYISTFAVVHSERHRENLRQSAEWFIRRRLAFRFSNEYGVRIDGVQLSDLVVKDEKVLEQLSAVAVATLAKEARTIKAEGIKDVLDNIINAIQLAFPDFSKAEVFEKALDIYGKEALRDSIGGTGSGNSVLPVLNVPNPATYGEEDQNDRQRS